jgi:hypothetical protein
MSDGSGMMPDMDRVFWILLDASVFGADFRDVAA